MADLDSPINLLSHLDTDMDQLSSQSSPRDGCPSLSYTFLSDQPLTMYSEATRRLSFASTATQSPASGSPGWYSAQFANTTSPTTPMVSMEPLIEIHQMKMEHNLENEQMYMLRENGLPEFDMWMGDDEPSHVSQMGHSTVFPLMNSHGMGISDETSYRGGYASYPQTVSMSNPALSRSIFDTHGMAPQAENMLMEESNLAWSIMISTPPQTIAPSAAFRPLLASLPILKQEPSTPIRLGTHSSSMLGSSLMGLISPPVVPSQHVMEDAGHDQELNEIASELRQYRGGVDRLHRRGYERRRQVGSSSRPRAAAASRSGMLCEAVIPQNEFACGYPGCIDKQTGHPKRFKRQEHKKRHEKTVHEKSKHGVHQCWVSGCKTAPFTRTDNLKSHLKNTHGKKSANQRNKYVATLDKSSEYFDPDWEGELTGDGYPVLIKKEEGNGRCKL